jgi:hypothetical protein
MPSDVANIIKEKLYKNFTMVVDQIKKSIISEYDELINAIDDPDSKANPALYREDFIERLNNFSFIKNSGETVSINVPDMETFDFSGRLKILEVIMNGVSGNYVEMDGKDFKSIFTRTPFTPDSSGSRDLSEEDIYLIKYNENIHNIEKHLRKKFVVYPFSNMPPFDVLEKGKVFVEDNMEKWIKNTLKEVQDNLKGATL